MSISSHSESGNNIALVPVPVQPKYPIGQPSLPNRDAVTQHRLVLQKYQKSAPRDGVTRYDGGGEGRGTCHSQAPRPTQRRRPRPLHRSLPPASAFRDSP